MASWPKPWRTHLLLFIGVCSFRFFNITSSSLRCLGLNSVSERIPLKLPSFSYSCFEHGWCNSFAWFQLKILTPTPKWLSFLDLQEQGFVQIQLFYWNQKLKQDFHHSCCNDYRGGSGVDRRGLKAMGSTVLCYSSQLDTTGCTSPCSQRPAFFNYCLMATGSFWLCYLKPSQMTWTP